MNLSIKKGAALKQKTPCLVIGVFEGKLKEPLLQQLDSGVDGAFSRAVKSKEFAGRAGETLLLHAGKNLAAERILLWGLGKEKDYGLCALRKAASGATKLLTDRQLGAFQLALPQLPIKKIGVAKRVQAAAEGVLLADYRYERYLPKDRPNRPAQLDKVALLIGDEASKAEAETAVQAAEAIVSGVCFARDLVNAPGN